MKIFSHGVLDNGFDGILVDIECNLSNSLPNIIIVGFVSKAVDESKERIRSAFANSSINLPRKRIIINIAPAGIPKDSTSLDLAIALSIIIAGKLAPRPVNDTILIGELGLDGSVRAVRGIIGKLMTGKKYGINEFIIPQANLKQARLVPNIRLYPVSSLSDVYLHFTGVKLIQPIGTNLHVPISPTTNNSEDFKFVVGQTPAKRGLEIAASGGHNILLSGPPGTGKSMLAKATVSILPPLNPDEALEVTHLHSLSNHNFEEIVGERPFRAPHHTASNTAIIGGGKNPRPGEISLSHHGVLFFDEFPEFNRPTLEALRQPLEDSKVTVSRAKDTITFPANFMLIATANPCPCGYYGTHRDCICTPQQISRYQRKISGPIIDRIDIFTDVENVNHNELLSQDKQSESSQNIALRVAKARSKQQQRFGKTMTNSNMTSQDIIKYAFITSDTTKFLNIVANKMELSPRSYMRTIKVARTIADLDQSDYIEIKHITEALQYRPKKIQLL